MQLDLMVKQAQQFGADREPLFAKARSLAGTLKEMAPRIDEARMVSRDVIAMLTEAGLMHLSRPAKFGGPELGGAVTLQISRILAEGSGSVAWVYSVLGSHDHLVGLYPQAVQEAYWASSRPLCASSYQPQGKVEKAEGGYRLTGQWGFSSGIDHCDWVVVGSLMFDGDGPPSLLLFMLNVSEYEIIDDWYVAGLRGTGSKSVKVTDLFVPAERVLDNRDVLAGTTPGASLHPSPLYSTSIWYMFGFSILAPAPGIARGAYRATVEAMREKAETDRTFPSRRASVERRLAEISVKVEACELLYSTALEETEALIMAGEPLSDELRTRNRRNQAYIAFACREAVDGMMQLAGGRGLHEHAPIQRAMRDLYAISAHPGGNLDSAFTSYGSVALGGKPTEMFC